MLNVAVLIPCHVNYDGQIDLFNNCIDSLLQQTVLPKSIYISLSFENDTYKREFVNLILQKYGKISKSKINFRFSKEKKYQMEHLHIISSNIDEYDMLMFCDDDDTYHCKRVEEFATAFTQCKDIDKFGGIREIFKSDTNPTLDSPEYWAYGVVPNVMKDFFEFFKNEDYGLLQHKFGDMYFRHYLRKNKKYLNWVGLLEEHMGYRLYNYNVNNQYSVCGKIQDDLGSIYDNILLEVLDCRSNSQFHDIIKKYNVKKMKPVFTHIYRFCKSLYT